MGCGGKKTNHEYAWEDSGTMSCFMNTMKINNYSDTYCLIDEILTQSYIYM